MFYDLQPIFSVNYSIRYERVANIAPDAVLEKMMAQFLYTCVESGGLTYANIEICKRSNSFLFNAMNFQLTSCVVDKPLGMYTHPFYQPLHFENLFHIEFPQYLKYTNT
jgi:hypothetical protein